MKIYIGPYGISDIAVQLNRGLQEQGVKTRFTSIRKGKNPFFFNKDRYDLYYTSDNHMNVMLKKMREFISSCTKYDVFIFTFCVSFGSSLQFGDYRSSILSYFDLPLLKAMGKKIVFIVLGTDLRSIPILIKECEESGLKQHAKYLKKDMLPNLPALSDENIKKAKMINKYGDIIFTRSEAAQLLSRPHELIWLGIDLDNFKFNISKSKEPLVIHAASRRFMKGTTYIENALNRLQKENYKFKFVLCENMNNNEVRRLLSESTIVIDQLILPGYGLFAVEAMASGNVVLGSTVPGVNEIPKEIPIIPTTPDDIYENLKRVLTARETWKNLILKGREYVERHHDYRKTSKNILEIIKKKIY